MRTKQIIIYFWIITLTFGIPSIALCQNKAALEKSKKKLEQEIQKTSDLLNQNKKTTRVSLNELNLLTKNIGKRQSLISTLGKEVNVVSSQIGKLSNSVRRLETDINTLKKEYAAMLQSSFIHRNKYNQLMFIFASENFNQAYRRLQYLKQYGEYQRMQLDLIKKKQDALHVNLSQLEEQKQAKNKLLLDEEQEKKKLEKEQVQKNKVIAELKKKEKSLTADLRAKQKKADQLKREIEKIIQAEIKKSNDLANKKAQKEGKAPAKTTTTTYSLTPAEKTLSSSFSSNKGKLPWPAERGVISSSFGSHPHPVLKGVKVNNNGIDIAVPQGTQARSIFEGTVSNVVNLYNVKFVMIRHGEYTSVYSNLDRVHVKPGDKVKTKQTIGRVYTNQEENKTELQFQIWKGTSKLDPSAWIVK